MWVRGQHLESPVWNVATVQVGRRRGNADGWVGRIAIPALRWRGRLGYRLCRSRRSDRGYRCNRGRWGTWWNRWERTGDQGAAEIDAISCGSVENIRHGCVRRVVLGYGPAAGRELAIDEHVADVDVAQQAAVAVCVTHISDHANRLAVYQPAIGGGCFAAAWPARLGGVDADVAHSPGCAVEVDDDRVAVDDADDGGNLAG